MSKTLYGFLAGILAGFLSGALLMGDREKPTITMKPIKANVIPRDYKNIKSKDIEDLQCYDEGDASLDISPLSGDDYLLTAGLCGRKWSREANISRPVKRNAVFLGLSYSIPSGPGAQALYFRRVGCLYVGGGVTVYQSAASLQAGGMVQF